MTHISFIPHPGAEPILWAEIGITLDYIVPAVIREMGARESGTFRFEMTAAKDSPIGQSVSAVSLELPAETRTLFHALPSGGSVFTMRLARK